MKPRVLAIIPARGGSKRIERKNLKLFSGQEIIGYPIEALKSSGVIDDIIVSTEDTEIAEVAKKFGADVPFLRSAKNADDFATTFDVISEVLSKVEQDYDYVCCLYPTSVFVTAELIKEAFERLSEQSEASSIATCIEYSHPIQRALSCDDGYLQPKQPEYYNSRTQDLEIHYHDAGQLYLFKPSAVLESKRLITELCIPLVLDGNLTQDIDTLADWELAELKFSYIGKP